MVPPNENVSFVHTFLATFLLHIQQNNSYQTGIYFTDAIFDPYSNEIIHASFEANLPVKFISNRSSATAYNCYGKTINFLNDYQKDPRVFRNIGSRDVLIIVAQSDPFFGSMTCPENIRQHSKWIALNASNRTAIIGSDGEKDCNRHLSISDTINLIDTKRAWNKFEHRIGIKVYFKFVYPGSTILSLEQNIYIGLDSYFLHIFSRHFNLNSIYSATNIPNSALATLPFGFKRLNEIKQFHRLALVPNEVNDFSKRLENLVEHLRFIYYGHFPSIALTNLNMIWSCHCSICNRMVQIERTIICIHMYLIVWLQSFRIEIFQFQYCYELYRMGMFKQSLLFTWCF